MLEVEKGRLVYKIFDKQQSAKIARIESALLSGARKYFEKNKFIEIVVPHLTKATGSCENIDTLFGVDYFGRIAYLSQTGQLYLESLIPQLKRVWCIGPSFRAEPEADNRHLTEFPLIELEFEGNFKELLIHTEKLIYSMIQEVIESDIDINKERLEKMKLPFKRLSYTEAVEMLKYLGIKWGDDLKGRHEKMIVEQLGNQPVFITHFPKTIKFFNMRTNSENPKIVNSSDLILPISGEAVGAAEREFEYKSVYQRLIESPMFKRLLEKGGGIEDFDWYLKLLKEQGNLPHAGCGIGLNRVTQFVLGIGDIRDTTVFPLNSKILM